MKHKIRTSRNPIFPFIWAAIMANLPLPAAVAATDEAVGQRYVAQVQSAVKEHWYPPVGPVYREILVVFQISKEGKASNIEVKKSCGDVSYDTAAIAAVRDAQPFIPPPPPLEPGVWMEIGIAYNPRAQVQKPKAIHLYDEAGSLMNAGKQEEAIKKLEQSIDCDPSYQPSRSRLARIYHNAAMYETDDKKALKLMHKALTLAPDEDDYANLDRLIRKSGKDPSSFDDRLKLGDEASKSGDLDGAVYEYAAALKIKHDDAVQTKLDDATKKQSDHNVSKTGD